MEEAYVIKNSDGHYFMCFHHGEAEFGTRLWAAAFWTTKSDVEDFIDGKEDRYFKDCRVVTLHITEVEDNMREETIKLINEIYKLRPAGGEMHIVLDDGNVEDGHIQWCIDNSIKGCENKKEKALYLNCANNLLKMTERQREAVIAEAYRSRDGIL